ncbi:MAG TPA: hypothetical protein VKR58_08205 [Aquella sp.]|nr:hypothetical protein [Aquella sp.]
MMRYFFECCFNASEYFDTLDSIIEEFKKEREETQYAFIKELYHIIQTKNYKLASNIIEEYSYKILNLEQTERVLTYIYKKLLDQPAILDTRDFYKDCKVVFCPVCCPDPEVAIKFNLIEKATVIGKDLQIYICKPCKLVWLTEDIRSDNAQDYKKFMKSLGLKGLWKELTDVDIL